MFDIDGTLVESFDFDEKCYCDAVFEVLGHHIDSDWPQYKHVTDSGILNQHLDSKGLLHLQEAMHAKVKKIFIANIDDYVTRFPVQEIKGAKWFLDQLKTMPNVSLSIATGGWEETARMKLKAANFDISDIPIASSNDHYSRTEIMRMAFDKSEGKPQDKITYFGDAEWDKKACKYLGFNFVLVGNKATHSQNIIDFESVNEALSYIGL